MGCLLKRTNTRTLTNSWLQRSKSVNSYWLLALADDLESPTDARAQRIREIFVATGYLSSFFPTLFWGGKKTALPGDAPFVGHDSKSALGEIHELVGLAACAGRRVLAFASSRLGLSTYT